MNNWAKDQSDQVELAKNHAYLLGSFTNPEAVKSLLDDSNKHISDDEDFEKATAGVLEGKFDNKNIKKNKRRKKRKRRLKG